jgi:hypothetical protein
MAIRRFLAVGITLLLALPLIAAMPVSQRSVVVVYPFSGKAGMSPDVGQNVALVVALTLSQTGDITIKTPPADTAQSDFQHVARSLGADFYVVGFLSPLGSQMAVSEQLVSTRSGISVWQTASTIAQPQDASDVALQAHEAIMHLSAQQLPESVSNAPAPPPAAPPAARTSGGSHPAPTVPSSAVAAAGLPVLPQQLPSRTTAMILPFTGDAIGAILRYVPDSLIRTMPDYGLSGTKASVDTSNVAEVGVLLCSQYGANELIGGSLDVSQGDPGLGWSFITSLDLKVYDCNNLAKKPLDITASSQNGNVQTAVDIAVDQALRGLPGKRTTSMR